jgi:hypothetical protein
MIIKKFNEISNQVINDISNERVIEILDEISQISKVIDEGKSKINTILNELINFRSESTTSNDQIDDSVSNLEMSSDKLMDALTNLDTVSKNLNDYNESGRKYLY